jgi:hypothetical protein
MPKGPQGQKRPAEAHRCAIMVAKLSTGEIEEVLEPATPTDQTGHTDTQQRMKDMRAPIAKHASKTRKVLAKDS